MPDSIRELWDFQGPAESERRFRDAIAVETAQKERRLELQTQVARALGLQERFDEGHAVLDEVEASLGETTPLARVRYLLERGRLFNSAGSPKRSLPFFEEVWKLGRSIAAHDLAVDAAHMLGIAAPPEERRAWNEAALTHAETSGDEEAGRWLGPLYNNMGWNAHDRGDYAEALSLHQKCWEWHRRRSTGRGERIARWSVAKQLRLLGRLDEAIAMHEELLEEYRLEEPDGDGFVHEEMGELLLETGKLEEARPHFARALAQLSGLGWVEPERLERLHLLATG
jgi:tetratricopeptide (TPR) repeat protein